MSNPTSNFGWQMPTATDLVTDLPADFEVFGQAVDTALMDLKGGTTGQVLAKASNTDMDFVWSADAAGMTNPMTTTGDMIYSSSGSTPARRGIGTTGQVLTVSGGVPTWATPAGGGKVLQVLSKAINTFQSINSSTYVDFTDFSLSITPSATTSKILIFISVGGWDAQSQTVANPCRISLRNGSNTVLNTPYDWYAPVSNSTTYPKAPNGLVSQSYLDSPATTSAVTYKVSGLNTSAPGSGFFMNNGATSSMTLMEIGA